MLTVGNDVARPGAASGALEQQEKTVIVRVASNYTRLHGKSSWSCKEMARGPTREMRTIRIEVVLFQMKIEKAFTSAAHATAASPSSIRKMRDRFQHVDCVTKIEATKGADALLERRVQERRAHTGPGSSCSSDWQYLYEYQYYY
jgi:hypothetical protein